MKRIHHYLIETTLCENKFVQVFRAKDKKGDKAFTLSLVNKAYEINPKILMRMISDGDKSSLTHPHIAKIIDFGEIEGQQYFVSDYIGSKTLSSFLGQPVSVTFALDVISQLASGLHFLSLHGYIHGNIHPDNIFFDAYGNAILSALELVPRSAENKKSTPSDDEPNVLITHYHSPEYIEENEASEVSDLYGLGVLLFEMLTGEHFDGEKYVADPTAQNVNQLIPYLAEDSFGFQPVINKLLAKKPKQRYQNGLQLVDALNEYDSRLSGIDDMNFPSGFDDDGVGDEVNVADVANMADANDSIDGIDKSPMMSSSLANIENVSNESTGGSVKAEKTDEVQTEKKMDLISRSKQLLIPHLDLNSDFHTDKRSKRTVIFEALKTLFAYVHGKYSYRQMAGGSVAVIAVMSLLFFLPDPGSPLNSVTAAVSSPSPVSSTRVILAQDSNTNVQLTERVAMQQEPSEHAVIINNSLVEKMNVALLQRDVAPPLITEFDIKDAKLLAAELSAEVDNLLFNAKLYLKQSRFTTPKNQNAYDMYLAILAIDPDNTAAQEGIESMVENYGNMAKRQIREHHYLRAMRYIRQGLVLEGGNEWLLSLQSEVSQRIKVDDTSKYLDSAAKVFAFDDGFE